jgi:hypothetical protein
MEAPAKASSSFKANRHAWLALSLAVVPLAYALFTIAMASRGWGSDGISMMLAPLALGSLLLSGPYGIYVAIAERKELNRVLLALFASLIGLAATGVMANSIRLSVSGKEDEQIIRLKIAIAEKEEILRENAAAREERERLDD